MNYVYITNSLESEIKTLKDKIIGDTTESLLSNSIVSVYKPINIYEIKNEVNDSNYWTNEFDKSLDYYFFKIPFTLKPPKDYKFVMASLELSYFNNNGEAITHSIAPKKVEDIISKELTYGVNFDGKLINAKLLPQIDFKKTEKFEVSYPRITSYYEGFPKAAWEVESTKKTPIIKGDQDFFLIIRQPMSSKTKVLTSVGGILVHKNIVIRFLGTILLKKLVKGKIEVNNSNFSFEIPNK